MATTEATKKEKAMQTALRDLTPETQIRVRERALEILRNHAGSNILTMAEAVARAISEEA